MSACSSDTPPQIGGITPASSAPVYRVSVIKYDRHEPDGEGHLNKYDSLIFKDREGSPWRLHAANQPGHYERLSNDTGLDTALDIHRLPNSTGGYLTDLRDSGAHVDFSTGGPSSSTS